MYRLAKSLDATRLVEDNSICCGRGHTETDINSWHVYLPGWEWDNYLKNLTENTYEGSNFDFEDGFVQGKQPNINSECGNVWGYQGSTGDVDYSWDYHRMINTFRKYPKVGGWLYTEHHDVINEWNGYWRFDRSEKETGLGDFVEGMTLNDLHSTVYLSTGNEICRTVKGGTEVEVPLYLSSMTNWLHGDKIIINATLSHINAIGETEDTKDFRIEVPYKPYMQKILDPLKLIMPKTAGISTLKLQVLTKTGKMLHRNFMNFVVESGQKIPNTDIISVPAKAFSNKKWSKKQWTVLDGKKINGTGKGFFEYTLKVPTDLDVDHIKSSKFLIEVSAKELFVKDMQNYDTNQDFMRGSKVSPSGNPNAYPMTDATKFPSKINVSIDGRGVYSTILADDPADHRGILSWHNQLKDKKLREAGSYGYLLKIPVAKEQLKQAVQNGQMVVRLETVGNGGIAVYGSEFGRYMIDPSLVIKR